MSLGGTDMVSKNNYQFYQQKHADGKQRWGIRKLSVGVASVLLGTTFMLYSNHAVLADTVPTNYTVKANSSDPQGSQTAADKEKAVGTTTNAEEKVVATNPKDPMQGQNPPQGQDTTQDKDKQTNANETTKNTTKVGKKDTDTGNVADLQDSLRTTAEEKGVATNRQDTPQGQDTPQNPSNVDKKDTDTGNVADLQDSLRTTAEEKGVATSHQDTPQGQGTPQNPTNEKGITPNVWAARLLAALVVNTNPNTSNKVEQKITSSAVGLKDATPVPPVSGQDRASIGSISKETVDLSGTPVYDDFNTWAGYSTNEFGPNKTISVVVTQDANNPNLKHYEITFLPTSRFYNGNGNRDYKMSNARMGFALSKDLTIVGNINFKTYYYLNNADNFKDGKTSDAKVLDKEFLIDHGKLYDAQGHSLSKVFYSDYGAWSNAWSQARRDANYSHDQSLLISNMKYADNATQVHNHFFNDVPGWDGTSPRVSYWGQREVQRQGNGMGMFAESITMNADSNPSTKGQYNQADFTQAYMWKSWGAWNNTQAGTYTVSFDAISNPDIKAKQTFSGVITAFGTYQGGSSYYYGHLTGEEISKVREYKNITVQVEDKFDTKGLENVTMPEREITIGYQKITNEVEGVNGVYTVENPYDQYKNISDKYPSTVVNTGDTFTHQYSVNVIVPKAGTQVVYLDANQTAPAKTADGKNLMADEYTPEDVAKDTGVTAPEIKGYTLTQTRSFDAKTGTLTVTNNYVRTVPLEELSKEVKDYTTKVKDFLSYVTSDDFFNAWKYNPTDQTVTPPQDSSTAYEEAYKTRLAALNDAAKTLKNDISALDPANYEEYGYQYNSLLDTYTRAVAPFDSSTGTLVKDLSTLYTDLSKQDPQTGKFVLDWSNLPIDGQANGNIYRSNLSDSLSSWMLKIGSKRTPGTIIKGIYDLVDGAENIKTTPRYTEASQPRQAAFDQALKNLKPQLTNVTNFKDLGDYYNLMDSQNKLKEAIYRLDHVTPTEDTTVTYTFYDKTDKKLVKGHDVTVTGQPGTDQKVNLTTPEGYKLAEGQTLPTSVTMPKATKTITINLVHATKDIKPNDPGVNPSDPVYADMFKTVTRTIKVNNPDRMVDTTTQQVNFNRTKTIDEVTDEVISYGKWTLATGSAKDWSQFNVPQLDGFISYVDGNAAKEVAEENVTADTADVTVEVTYKNYTPTPTDTTVTYTFYDKTDKKPVEGHDVTVTGQPGTDQKVNLTTPEGYKLAEGQTLPTSVTMPKATKTITINLVHATKDIKPNDPGVNPSDPVYADMFKTVTRTIKVNNPDRMVDTTTQQVNFNRTKTIDEVTDEVISYGKWTLATGSAKDWSQFNVPQLDGFISYVDGNAAKEVAEENVTADTADVTVEVTYKNSGNNGNNTTPGDDGNHNTNPGDNGNHNTNPGNNGNNNGINNGTQNGNSDETVNTNVTNNGNGDNSQNNKQALPQTGNTKNDAAVAGLGLAGLLAMLGLGGLKKKRN